MSPIGKRWRVVLAVTLGVLISAMAMAGIDTSPGVTVDQFMVDPGGLAVLSLPLTWNCASQPTNVRFFLGAGPEIVAVELTSDGDLTLPGDFKALSAGEFNRFFVRNPATISMSQTVQLGVLNASPGQHVVTFGAFVGNPNEIAPGPC